jgi:hypothetical protein
MPDDDSEEESGIDDETRQRIVAATPNTRKRIIAEIDEQKVGKIGPLKTFFTLMKGFVATGVLFLPKGWKSGGWLFST